MSDLYDHVLSKPELRQSKPSRADFAVQARNPVAVVLDGVRGYYNIGAIFRLCDAFLVERLIICGEESQGGPHRVPPLLRRRKLVQAAMGTQRWVPWQEEPDAAAVVRAAKAAGYWIAVVELTAESVSLAAMHPRYPAALVLGNERSGVSQEVLAYADQAIAIPMLGMANSLNVATAGAIVLHELVRRADQLLAEREAARHWQPA
jgi:tRNA G18 (ribose-2'-O)-methylase SpoU